MTYQEYILQKENEKLKEKLREYEKNRVKRGDVVWITDKEEENQYSYKGRRPYIVISNDVGNRHSPMCNCIPMTTKNKRSDLPSHVKTSYNNSYACCECIKTFDQSRIENIAFNLNNSEMEMISQALREQLEL